MKKIILGLIILGTILFSGCSRCSSELHTWRSETFGLEREVILYSYDGDTLGYWAGNINVISDTGTQEIYFDVDGKRTVLYGGIVKVQEK